LAFDNFQDLSISFTKGLQQLNDVSLDRLMEKFLEEETLDEYRCSKCKKTHKNKK
jgi:ubiquitin carboxyl-terminal hydrolase 2